MEGGREREVAPVTRLTNIFAKIKIDRNYIWEDNSIGKKGNNAVQSSVLSK